MNYNDITPRTQAWADLKLLKRSVANNILGRWGQSRTLPQKKSQTINFRRYEALDSDPTVLAEGVSPQGKVRTYTDYTCVLKQFGDFVSFTDVIKDTHEDPVLNDNLEALGEQADEMMDKMRFGVLKAGTNKLLANGTLRTDITANISRDLVRTAVRIMEKQKAKPLTEMIVGGAKINTYPIPEAFIGVCHTDMRPDLERCSGFKDVSEYAANMGVIPGEIGSIGRVRFVGDTNCVPFADAGGDVGTTGNLSTSASKCDVYPILIFGKDAYGVVQLAGKNAMETLISNPRPQASDPLAQRGSQGWKGWNGCVILNDYWMLRMEVACKG